MFLLFLNSIMEEPTLGEQLVVLLLQPAMIMMLPLMNTVNTHARTYFPVYGSPIILFDKCLLLSWRNHHAKWTGLIRQPKYDHLKELHKAVKSCEQALISADPSVISLGNYEQVCSHGHLCTYIEVTLRSQLQISKNEMFIRELKSSTIIPPQ